MPDICDVRFGWSGSAVYPAVHTLGTRSQSWQPLMLLSETVIDWEENIWASSVSAKGLIENKNPPQETQGESLQLLLAERIGRFWGMD